LDPATNSFVGKKIGSFDGEYPLNSAYVMIEMADEAPFDALPCGFYGLDERIYESPTNPSPFPIIKNRYFYPGETLFDPPFGTTAGGSNVVTASGDNVRRSYLGISSFFGIDSDLLQYKGRKNPTVNWYEATDSEPWNYQTQGFHFDSGATVVTIANAFVTSGTPAFVCGIADFKAEPTTQANPYYFLYSRKFTFMFVCHSCQFSNYIKVNRVIHNDVRVFAEYKIYWLVVFDILLCIVFNAIIIVFHG
jgi:hypothetical protein